MKAIVKLKFWPWMIVGLVCLFGTIGPFANQVARFLESLTQLVGTILPGVLTVAYTTVAPLLGPLTPAAGSQTEVVLKVGLGIVAGFTGVGILTELARLLDRHHRQRPESWICQCVPRGKSSTV